MMNDELKKSYYNVMNETAEKKYDKDMETLKEMLDNENLTLTERRMLGLLMNSIINLNLSKTIELALLDEKLNNVAKGRGV